MKLTEEKLVYLLFLYNLQSTDDTITSLAARLGISKSTLSRVLHTFYEAGLTDTKGKGKLSKEGIQVVKKLNDEIEQLANWLITQGKFNFQEAHDEAKKLILHLSESAKKKLLYSNSMATFYKNIAHVKHLDGDFLCANLADGNYPFVFTIYKKKMEGAAQISMANEGFLHPGILRIKQGRGVLCLQAKEIEYKSKLASLILKGIIVKLKYEKDGVFIDAKEGRNCFNIPIREMEFHYNNEERLLQGSICIQMKSNVSELYVPDRVAVLIIMFK